MAQLLSLLCRMAFLRLRAPSWAVFALLGLPLLSASAQESLPPTPSPPWQLDLGVLGWLPGAPADGEGDYAWWQLPGGVLIPVDTLWIRGLGRDGIPRVPGAETDLLWVSAQKSSPDLRKGWLTSWQAEGLRFQGPGGERLHSWEKLVALQLLAEPMPFPQGETTRYLVFEGGGFLRVQALREKEGTWVAQLPWDREVELKKEDLSDVFPGKYSMPPVLKMTGPEGALMRTPRQGRSVEGAPLRCGSKVWPSGWGTMVPSSIDFEWDGPSVFQCWVGVDEEVLGFQNSQPVSFQVYLNGKLLWESPPMKVQDAPLPVSLAVPKKGVLSLRTKAAQGLPWGGHANWLMPTQSPVGSPNNIGASTW
ncbi:MAG: NPCBM/NEW2 domain-containing protein [Planctomycetota bacterium]|nr:NPCBM/NEW2 domain-containing protein [Planctomycetota bacterium]